MNEPLVEFRVDPGRVEFPQLIMYALPARSLWQGYTPPGSRLWVGSNLSNWLAAASGRL